VEDNQTNAPLVTACRRRFDARESAELHYVCAHSQHSLADLGVVDTAS